MAYTTENEYTGNGSTLLYSFTFPYIDTTDIKVSLNQVDTTNFTLANDTQIQFTADAGGATSTQESGGAPKNTVKIRIYRDTNIDDLKSEFFSGSAVRAQDLNEDFRQNLYNSQETEKAVETKWNKTTDTIDSTEAFSDSDDYLMTAKAIDDRVDAKISTQPLTDGKILVGNGSNVAAQVTMSGDATLSNAGALTIATGAVEHAMLAGDSVDGDNLADEAVDSEHYVDGSIDLIHLSANSVDSTKIVDGSIANADINSGAAIAHSKLASVTAGQIIVGNGSNVPAAVAVSGDATLASSGALTIAADAVDGSKISDNAIDSGHYHPGSIDNAHIADGTIDTAKLAHGIAHNKLATLNNGNILVGDGSNNAASVAVSGDVTIANTGAVTIANDAVEIGMIGCEQTTITDSDSHIPTSGAVVDYVASVIAPIGGLEVIDDDESFPNTIPAAGVVVSITDAAGLSVNSSGVSTNGDALDNSTITINGFPSELRGGVGGNADPYVFASGAGLMVVSTGSSQTYNYHQAMIRESDFVQLSDDINDFNSRYRIGTRTANSASSNDDGDLFFDTGTNKMYVYDGAYDAGGSWKEVTSAGDYKFLTIKTNGQAHDGSLTFDGSATQFDLFDGTSDASITNAAQLIVVLNGIVQKPNSGTYSGSEEGFYLDGSDGIRFCDGPPNGSVCFVTQIGTATTIGTPGTGSINASAMFAAGVINAAAIGTNAVTEDKILISNAAADGKFLQYKDSSDKLTWATVNTDLVSDTSPQLGGDLDVNGQNIVSTSNADIDIIPNGTGNINLDADTVRVGDNNADAVITSYGTGNLKLATNNDGTGGYIQLTQGTNGGIQLQCAGTGDIQAVGDTLQVGDQNADATITTFGTGDLTLSTNGGTDSGSIEIEDGANNDIIITPNGSGDIILDGLKYPQADGSAGQFLKTDGSAQLSWATVSSTPEGEAVLSTTNSNEASTKFLRADGDGTCSWQIPPAATATSGTDNFTVSDGNLIIGTAGHGIDFSAHANASWGSGASTTTEILDHYEVGEFTPYIRGGGTDFDHTSTHGHREGDFVRIGELVHVYVRVGWNNTNSASGAITIRGFPFRCKSNSGGYYQTGSFSDFWGFFPDTYSIIMMVGGNDYAYIHGVESEAALNTSDFGTGNGGFSFGFTYSTHD